MKDLMYVRVLEHDTEDQIRIGMSFPIDDIKKAVENIISSYDKKFEWCGGFAKGCNKYYKRLAIVDSESLSIIQLIYLKPNK